METNMDGSSTIEQVQNEIKRFEREERIVDFNLDDCRGEHVFEFSGTRIRGNHVLFLKECVACNEERLMKIIPGEYYGR